MFEELDITSEQSLVTEGVIRLRKGEGRLLKRGGAWVYDNEMASVSGDFENGEIVTVEDFDGYFLGYGFYNEISKIRVRILSRKKDVPVTPAFIAARAKTAWDYRKAVIDTSSCRVVFGEADFLPGLTIDKYEDVLVVESLALGSEQLKPIVLKALISAMAEDGITIRGIYERSDAKVRTKEGLVPYKGFIGPEFETKVQIVENGVKYIVDVENGQKTGFFLDQKENRKAIHRLVPGKRVLDCFTHTGSFALNAAVAGAASVDAVDASQLAIDQATENAVLNGVQDKMNFICADAFEFLREAQEREPYDVVILDPPAFTKSRNSIKAAVKGYREINIQGMKLVKDNGYFITASCSHFMDPDLFANTIAQAARDAHVQLRQVEFKTQAPDHPILWAGDDNSYYLKFYIFQLVRER